MCLNRWQSIIVYRFCFVVPEQYPHISHIKFHFLTMQHGKFWTMNPVIKQSIGMAFLAAKFRSVSQTMRAWENAHFTRSRFEFWFLFLFCIFFTLVTPPFVRTCSVSPAEMLIPLTIATSLLILETFLEIQVSSTEGSRGMWTRLGVCSIEKHLRIRDNHSSEWEYPHANGIREILDDSHKKYENLVEIQQDHMKYCIFISFLKRY